ncbi:MAG: metalloregulator ArsR/SmtB family transcription factor [Castellaniella sp.]
MRAHVGEATALLKALANEDRLMLLCRMIGRRLNVGELAELTGIQQPTLSQQLGVLRHEGLVSVEREGRYMYYQLSNPDVMRVMQALWEVYCAPR